MKRGTRSSNVHVVPSQGRWEVKIEGLGGAGEYRTQNEAIRAGRELARAYRSENIIHGRDGRIRQRDSYGHDPFPPRG